MSLEVRHIEAYVFRRSRGAVQVLLLRRAPGRKLGGVWQPVTGKLQEGETVYGAAAREVREETGLQPLRWWLLESPLLYHDRGTAETLVLPRFAAEVDRGSRVTLSEEHTAHAFLSPDRASTRLLWDSQREALRLLRRQVWKGGPLARTLEIPAASFRRTPLAGEE